MKIIRVNEKDIKNATNRILSRRMVYHPRISPKGVLDFSNYLGKEYVCIFDRNIYTDMIEICKRGSISNKTIQSDIASMLLWMKFNSIRGTGGIALTEYCNSVGTNNNANFENEIFKAAFEILTIDNLLKLTNGESINPITISSKNQYDFEYEPEHFRVQYLVMLKINAINCEDLPGYKKFIKLFQWIESSIPIPGMTLIYAALLFSNKIKPLYAGHQSYVDIVRKCRNQAWDLTYLSVWSTLFWDDIHDSEIFLLCTFDKAMKSIMEYSFSYKDPEKLFKKIFGKTNGLLAYNRYTEILENHTKKEVNIQFVEGEILFEEGLLSDSIELIDNEIV